MISSSPRADGRSAGGDLDHLVVIEIQAGDSEERLRLRRLLFEADRPAIRVELDHAVAFRISHLVTKDRGAVLARGGAAQVVRKMRTVENVVAERECDPVARR